METAKPRSIKSSKSRLRDNQDDADNELRDLLRRGPPATKILDFSAYDLIGPSIILLLLLLSILKLVASFESPVDWYFPTCSRLIACAMMFQFIGLSISRFLLRGVPGLTDPFWACNFGLLLCASGVWLGLPSIVGSTVVLLAFEHATFVIDCIGWMATGRFLIGSASYLANAHWAEYVSTAHHIWFIPATLTVLWRSDAGITAFSFPLSCLVLGLLTVLGRFCFPLSISSCEERSTDYKSFYINVNMGHEFTRTVAFPLVHKCDRAAFIVYWSYLMFLGCLVCNLPMYFLLTMLPLGA